MSKEKIIKFLLKVILVGIFILVCLPGLFAIYTFLMPAISGFEEGEPNEFQKTILKVFPLLMNIPAEISMLVTAAFPAFIIKTAYQTGDTKRKLSKAGLIGLFILMIGGVMNFIGSLCILPSKDLLYLNYADTSVLTELKSLTVKATYFCLFYFLMFTQLRPK